MSTPDSKEESVQNTEIEIKSNLMKKDHITQKKLLHLHQQKLQFEHNYNNNNNIQTIVDIFGGIDYVLEMLLSSDQTNLNKNQLLKINDIITETNYNKTNIINKTLTPQLHKQKTIIVGDEIPEKWTYCFSTTNTYLHSIFGNNIGQKLFNILYSKYTVILTIVLFVLQIFVAFDINVYVRICVMILCVLCALFMILSANRRCFKLITKSFAFWFKLLYATQMTLSHIICSKHEETYIIAGGIEIFGGIALFAMFALVDAFQIKLLIKILIGSLFACGTTLFAIVWSLDLFLNKDDSIIYIEFVGWHISMKSIRMNAIQILSIFMWKQVITSVLKNNRCVLIKYSPYLEWINPNDVREEYNQSIVLQLIETNISKKSKNID